MKQIIDFPCIPFAQLPTPLYKLENLSREIGKNIYIKRDDMTGVALGMPSPVPRAALRSIAWPGRRAS